jgi:hypothetical protein
MGEFRESAATSWKESGSLRVLGYVVRQELEGDEPMGSHVLRFIHRTAAKILDDRVVLLKGLHGVTSIAEDVMLPQSQAGQ